MKVAITSYKKNLRFCVYLSHMNKSKGSISQYFMSTFCTCTCCFADSIDQLCHACKTNCMPHILFSTSENLYSGHSWNFLYAIILMINIKKKHFFSAKIVSKSQFFWYNCQLSTSRIVQTMGPPFWHVWGQFCQHFTRCFFVLKFCAIFLCIHLRFDLFFGAKILAYMPS